MEKNFQFKNIFLTGEKGCGKSTLINNFTAQSKLICTGFKMEWQYSGNVKTSLLILPYNAKSKFNPIHSELPAANYIAGYWNGVKAIPNPEGFENTGIKILQESLAVSIQSPDSSLIILDELGILEKNATNFKNEVIQVLDSRIRVLGVLKKKSSVFSDILIKRSDTLILEINPDTRDHVNLKIFFNKTRRKSPTSKHSESGEMDSLWLRTNS